MVGDDRLWPPDMMLAAMATGWTSVLIAVLVEVKVEIFELGGKGDHCRDFGRDGRAVRGGDLR